MLCTPGQVIKTVPSPSPMPLFHNQLSFPQKLALPAPLGIRKWSLLSLQIHKLSFQRKLWVPWGGRHSWNRELKAAAQELLRRNWTKLSPLRTSPNCLTPGLCSGQAGAQGDNTCPPALSREQENQQKPLGGTAVSARLQAQVHIVQWRSGQLPETLGAEAVCPPRDWSGPGSSKKQNRTCSCGKHQEPDSEQKQKAFSCRAFTRCSHTHASIDSERSPESWDEVLPVQTPSSLSSTSSAGPRISSVQGGIPEAKTSMGGWFILPQLRSERCAS